MVDIQAQFDLNLRKSIKKKKQVAIIPIGSIEQHGPHLPISTDSDIVTEVAKRLSEMKGYLLLPTITYGVSFEHAPLFNLSIRESTLRTILIDLCSSLLMNNIKTVFIINGHHGNLKSIKNIDVKLQKISKNKLKVFPLSYWHFMKREFDHAGFVETSLMLAISKNVKMKLAKKGLITDGMKKQEIKILGKLANQSFPKATKNGIWGDPTKATKKDGKTILAEIIKNLGKKCQTCLTERSS
ncbi:creatininase family protein [Marine Group I thaumarchaeote]|jgi:creatinine amidohydrolase|uniref:Creatininase family protein n=1 Tax=Marine Group I thaumarchaeote TaxID=2511932 RepID=A0A7K4NH67_9ARCH|nr:MAG: creatininase family protein [Nitrosopumilus sp. YT1]NMI81888.1 creatininase family protein [Candidatus Nitrosopumilus sp. MTA1]NWJ19829.1 creatininase family protein [Marine Group I thaumarchaeote]NWJ29155.1 creatininase family protein [Marine Group I thaumarchaeote]NWJ57576.1 creatininase family protein [Marine Group I thaumarchaeote]